MKKPQDVSYDQIYCGNKSAGPNKSSDSSYDYADVSKVVPNARMPPGYHSPSSAGDEAQSLNSSYNQLSHGKKFFSKGDYSIRLCRCYQRST